MHEEPSLSAAAAEIETEIGIKFFLPFRLETLWDEQRGQSREQSCDSGASRWQSCDSGTSQVETWWGCELIELVGRHSRFGLVWKIVYDRRKLFTNYLERMVAFHGEYSIDICISLWIQLR